MPDARMPNDHRGTRAIQRMVEFAPSTGGLALWVKHHDHPPTSDAPAVTTDGNTLFYGPSFEALPLPEQIGLVAHEVLHIALRHPHRYLELKQLLGDVDLKLYNICADAIVNSSLSHLSWLRLPRGAILLEDLLWTTLGTKMDAQTALLQWDVERLYRTMDDREDNTQSGKSDKKRQQSGGSEQSESGSDKNEQVSASKQIEDRKNGPKSSRAKKMGADILMDLVPTPDPNAPPEAEAQQALLWSERVQRSHASDGLHSMLRALLADLPKVRTPWEQVLRTQLARSLSKKVDISWSRPARSYIANQGRCGDRHMPFEPGFSLAKPTPRLVVIVDVSGSVDDKLLDRFALQIEAITRRQEASLVLIIGDDRVRKVARYEPGVSNLREIAFMGRGDTDFTPLLMEAEKHRPDITVVLTDLDGPARYRPRWPVIWAVPEADEAAVAPFGRKVVLS